MLRTEARAQDIRLNDEEERPAVPGLSGTVSLQWAHGTLLGTDILEQECHGGGTAIFTSNRPATRFTPLRTESSEPDTLTQTFTGDPSVHLGFRSSCPPSQD